jgi:glycosyltransferase domain-containing protein
MKIAALLIPTYRNSTQNIATLSYLSTFSSPDLHVFISDCSLNPEKHQQLKVLENLHEFVKIIYQTENIPLYRDVVNMLEVTKDYDFVGIVPDDDYVSLSYIQKSIDTLQQSDDCVCSYGNYLIYQSNGSAFRDSRSAIEETARDRVNTGFNPNYFNTMFFAVFRRSAMQSWMNFCKDHPMISSFFDFLHCLSLMAQGKVICHTEGNFLWTGENWDTPEANGKTRARYYTQIGLSEEFAYFHDLHFAVEGVNFLTGKHSPLSDPVEKVACAQVVWSRCMERFKNDVYRNSTLFEQCLGASPFAIQALNNLLAQEQCDEKNILRWFSEILSVFSFQKSQEYLAHHSE